MHGNVGMHLAKRAEFNPHLEALVDTGSGARLSYAELDRRANQVADGLSQLDLAKGDRVAVLLPNCCEFVEIFYGAARSGIVVVPLNWRHTADELAFVLNDVGATVLIFAFEFAPAVEDLHDRRRDAVPLVRHWLHVGPCRLDWAVDYEKVVRGASTTAVDMDITGDDNLLIMYTSGTTDRPKGVLHTHGTTEWSVLTVTATADLRFKDRYLICLPMFHIGALNPLWSTIYRGGTVVLMRTFNADEIWYHFRDEAITVVLAVPAMLHMMLDTYDADVHQPLQLRWITSGAAPVPPCVIEQYAAIGFEVHQVYGLTETCGPGCMISPDEALARIGSTGKAFFHTDIRLVDPAGRDVPPEVPGEVLLRGRHVMAGYWNRPEATADVLRDGWLRTGDCAVMDKDGYIYMQDRIKDMIVSGGENISPAEIEAVLISSPAIADAAVIGIPSARWGESPLAIVVKAVPDLDEAVVVEHCHRMLARYKAPKRVVLANVIPRNPAGKVLKRLLRDQFATWVTE